jgi:Protein of unknown function (DUF4238)
MNQLTRNQHHVPAFYLRQWRGSDSHRLVAFDLKEQSSAHKSPKKIMTTSWFYEEDVDAPDNRVENILGQIETKCAPHFAVLGALPISRVRPSETGELVKVVQAALTPQVCQAIKTFAALQYVRTPGAIERKRGELVPSTLSQEQKDYLLNAGRFTEAGFAWVENRFESLKLLVIMSTGPNFLTSDWPCFDFKDSNDAPVLGRDVGQDQGVVVCMPLTPRLAAILYPPRLVDDGSSFATPKAIANAAGPGQVRNVNTLVIQQADRFVVADEDNDFVLAIAAKRKKSRW